ncbi:MAG: dehydrogenase subunit [Cyanobacteria bacterium RYN_339]|nr:dehydrogenase subunit [Cyanobacteria bacterium RYN_339]
MPMQWFDWIIIPVHALTILLVALSLVPLLVWLERKASAYIQDRPGPERAAVGPFRLAGLFHLIADAIKMLTKEDIIPAGANRFFYVLAPMIVVAVGFTTVMCVPFFGNVDLRAWGGPRISGAVIDIDPGILWFFAIASLTVYGIIFAGWSSGSKYALLGAMRASAAVLSYEIPMGLSVIGPLMMYQSVNLSTISEWQGHHMWGICYQPLAAIIFTVCGFAETNRVPFDLAESESELVAGYHTEYSSMKFGMFFLGEYVAMVVSSCLIVTLFLGGYQVPLLPTEALIANAKPVLEWSLGIAFGLGLALTAMFLVNFASNVGRWKDWRDYESLILGILVLGGAVTALGGLFLVMALQLPAWFGVAFAGLAQFGMFTAKLLLLCWVFVWVRWTLPRFRYDQVMNLGWRSLLPLALVNILLTGVLIPVLMP